jgi:hypothetical protein
MPIGRSVDETLRLVQALQARPLLLSLFVSPLLTPPQFHAKHGEVCPANWKPGAKSMDASPAGSRVRSSLRDNRERCAEPDRLNRRTLRRCRKRPPADVQ